MNDCYFSDFKKAFIKHSFEPERRVNECFLYRLHRGSVDANVVLLTTTDSIGPFREKE